MKAFESEQSFLSTTFLVCLLVALIALLIIASLLIGPAHLSVSQAFDGLIRGTGV